MSKIKNSVKLELAEAYMVDSVLTVLYSDTVGSIQKRLVEEVENFDTISYIYVLNKSRKLIGVLSIQELFAAKNREFVENVMIKKVQTVRQSTHKEKVALLALKNNLKSIPVVNKRGIFKGIVPSDAILSILNNANLEDALLSAGISSSDNSIKNITNASLSYHLKNRFPWLILGLFGSMITAFIVSSFDVMLERQILLASFIPVIVYMSDAVGNQTQTIFIKAMTLDSKLDFMFYFLRETKLSIVLGMILSVAMFLISSLVWQQPMISFIFAFSLFMAVIGAAIMAVIMPVLLEKVKVDPAVASGPLASVMRDIYSLSIYLVLANMLLNLYG